MDQFSDADISGSELGDEGWFVDPEPLPEAAWVRIVSGAVTDADTRSDVDELVAPPASVDEIDSAAGLDDADVPDDPFDGPFGDLAADLPDPGWDAPGPTDLPHPEHDTDT